MSPHLDGGVSEAIVLAPSEAGQHRHRGQLGVMQLVLSLSPGGTEHLVTEIVKRLALFRTMVCCLDGPGLWGEGLSRSGTPVVALRRASGFRPALAKKIATVAEHYEIGVIHCHHYSPYVYGQLAARLLKGVKVVYTEHGRLSPGPPSLKRRLANQIFGQLPAAVYVVSDDLKAHLVSEGFPAKYVGVIRNGVDVRLPTGDLVRANVRARVGLTNGEFVIGTVGRLDPVKDLGVLIEGFARLRKRIDRARLVIVGDGVARESLTGFAAKFGLSEAVRFLGHREDVPDLLHAFDVYVSTSVFEGISLTLLEAMAAERPVIATAVGGTPEVVVHDVTGLLIQPRSPEAVADALSFLQQRPGVASAWGKAGRQRVLDQFTIDSMVRQYASVYAENAL